jgi:ketosteroid isomerase-like protein
MLKTLVAAALLVGANAAAASDQTDVMATMKQFIDGFNKGDVKTALAACASPASVIDEIPPYAWQGATACQDWANDFDAWAKKDGITDGFVTLGKAKHVYVTGEHAYVVAPASFKYKQKGKPVAQNGSTMTAALQKHAEGWRITAWTWSTR